MSSKESLKSNKVLVRNTERTCVSNHKVTKKSSCSEGSQFNFTTDSVPTGNRTSSDKQKSKYSDKDYADPELHSSKAILKQIRKVEQMVPKKFDDLNGLGGTSKILADKEISKQLNFHFNEKIYKDLVALNINDSDISSRVRKKTPVPSYISKMTKDIEPNLDDFYKDKPKLDKPIIPAPAKVKYNPIIKYNGRDIYERISSWESSG